MSPGRAFRGRSHGRRGTRAERRPLPRGGVRSETAHRRRLLTSWTGVLRVPRRRRWLPCPLRQDPHGRRLTSSSATAAPLAGGNGAGRSPRVGMGERSRRRPRIRRAHRACSDRRQGADARGRLGAGRGVRVLTRLQCADGGWNYGNASRQRVDLRGYAQTTAIALIALQGESERARRAPGCGFLRRTWHVEPGGLTTAQTLARLPPPRRPRRARAPAQRPEAIARRPSFLDRPVASRGRCSRPGRTR